MNIFQRKATQDQQRVEPTLDANPAAAFEGATVLQSSATPENGKPSVFTAFRALLDGLNAVRALQQEQKAALAPLEAAFAEARKATGKSAVKSSVAEVEALVQAGYEDQISALEGEIAETEGKIEALEEENDRHAERVQLTYERLDREAFQLQEKLDDVRRERNDFLGDPEDINGDGLVDETDVAYYDTRISELEKQIAKVYDNNPVLKQQQARDRRLAELSDTLDKQSGELDDVLARMNNDIANNTRVHVEWLKDQKETAKTVYEAVRTEAKSARNAALRDVFTTVKQEVADDLTDDRLAIQNAFTTGVNAVKGAFTGAVKGLAAAWQSFKTATAEGYKAETSYAQERAALHQRRAPTLDLQ